MKGTKEQQLIVGVVRDCSLLFSEVLKYIPDDKVKEFTEKQNESNSAIVLTAKQVDGEYKRCSVSVKKGYMSVFSEAVNASCDLPQNHIGHEGIV